MEALEARVGIVGVGSMGGAIARGLVESGLVAPGRLLVTDQDRARAEDVCQEVFLRLYRTNPAFQSPEHEEAFVLRVTINLCKDQLKSFWARRVVLDGEQEPPPGSDIADQVAANDQRRRLFTAVEGLPLPFRSVILLYYYQGMTTREIADTLGIPDATVRSRLKRAREKLSRTLKKGCEGE